MNNLELPSNFVSYDDKTKQNILEYLEQLNILEKKAYSIAKKHLGSSFDLIKSNGFIEWLQNK